MEVLLKVGPVIYVADGKRLWTMVPVISGSSIGKWRFYRQWDLWSVLVV